MQGAGKRPQWVLAVHGGAGPVRAATDAALEDDPVFNAGRGAVFTSAGTHELDASIMDGASGRAGAVAGVRTVRNPVRLARLVMERTPHVLMIAEGAEELAARLGVERVDPAWFATPRRRAQLAEVLARRRDGGDEGARGTVGAVALDRAGRLAAATSTGGTTAKLPGRVGDSPVIGAGTWADTRCAVSGTGRGEAFLRGAIAARVALAMELRGVALDEAAALAMARLQPDDGGFIALDADGAVVMPFNSEGMFRGVLDDSGRLRLGVWRAEEEAR